MKKTSWVCMFIPLLLLLSIIPAKADEKQDRTWQDESIYFLMVDRFSNGDFKNDYQVDVKDPLSYHGGDFAGIQQKLDYIQDMGFTAIWLTPIFETEEGGYHGYSVKDYFNIEKQFGTMEEFKALVDVIHQRGMKVILSFVVNHTHTHASSNKPPLLW